jgi:hypothetical protein
MHPLIEHPLLTRIRENLKEEFSRLEDDAKKGVLKNPLSISWIAKLLVRLDNKFQQKFAEMFKPLLNKMMLDLSGGLGKLNIPILKALFNSADILLASDLDLEINFKKELQSLLNKLSKGQWLSSIPLTSYAIYGLQSIASDNILADAKDFIYKHIGNEITEAITKWPEVGLGLPELSKYIKEDNIKFPDKPSPTSFRRSALILFILSEQLDQTNLELAEESILDLLDEMWNCMVKGCVKFDVISQSLVGLSIINLGFQQALLVNKHDYNAIQSFFKTESFAIPRKNEYSQELVILITTIIAFYIIILYLAPPLFSFISASPLAVIAENATYSILAFILGSLFFAIILPFLLPRLYIWVLSHLPVIHKEEQENDRH